MTNGSEHRETVKIDTSQRHTPAEKACGRVLSNEEHRKKKFQFSLSVVADSLRDGYVIYIGQCWWLRR